MMLLETQLDGRLASQRRQIRFMREFFQNFNRIELIAKEVHSRSDLQKFLNEAKGDRSIQAVHIVAHGRVSRKKSALVLTKGESIDLNRRENLRLFSGLKKEVIFFSCCQLGSNEQLMRRLLKTSDADAIFSYADDVNDYQSFIVESLFYHLAYGHVRGRLQLPLEVVHKKLVFSLDFLDIDDFKYPLDDPLLVGVFRAN